MQSVSLKLHSGIPSFNMYIYSIYLDKTLLVFTCLKTSGQDDARYGSKKSTHQLSNTQASATLSQVTL